MTERDLIESKMRDLIVAVLRDEQGDTAIVYRTYDGKTVPDQSDWSVLSWPEPADPVQAVEIARFIEQVAHGRWRRYAEEARGAGKTWLELAAVLDVDKDDPDKDHAAFMLVAGEPTSSWREPYVTFTCNSCRQLVRDQGPYGGHPNDCEQGHAETCIRQKAAIAQYLADWDDE